VLEVNSKYGIFKCHIQILFSPPAAALIGLNPWESEGLFPGEGPIVDFFIVSQKDIWGGQK